MVGKNKTQGIFINWENFSISYFFFIFLLQIGMHKSKCAAH